MAIQLDDLVARLRLDTAGMSSGLRTVDSQLGRVDARAGRASGSIAKSFLKVTAGLAIGAKAISFVGDSLGEGREANKVAALTEQRIKTMGDVAGISAKGVARLAESISRKTGIDDEQIQSSSNLLLSFSQVANRGKGMAAIFDRATKASVDLSAGGFGSIEGASKQLGKALQDPEKGVAALGRAGVTFTDQQKEQIKTLVESNHMLGAQKIVLGEVEKQVKGSAEAQATAADKARVGWANLQEKIGVALIPVVDRLATFFADKIVPAISKFIDGMQKGTGAGGDFADKARQIWKALQLLYDKLVPVVSFLIDNKDAVATFIAVLAGFRILTSIVRGFQALSAAMALTPFGAIALALAALAAGLVYAYQHSEKFRKIVDASLRGVAAVFRWLWNEVIAPVLRFLINGIASAMDVFGSMLDGLSHVPGFGWVGKLGDSLHEAADQGHGLADSINDIPDKHDVHVNVIVNTSAIDKVQHQLDMLGSNTRTGGASGQRPSGEQQQLISLPGILQGLIDGIARAVGPVESDVTNDVTALFERIEKAYGDQGDAAAKRIQRRFEKRRKELNAKLDKAEKTDTKKDDKELQAKLDKLDTREQAAVDRAIARYRAKAKAARAAVRSITDALIENGRQQDLLNVQIEAAQQNLAQLQQQSEDFAASVTATFRDFGKIIGLGVREVGDKTTLTTADLLADLAARVQKAAHFAQLISQLTAQGLNQATVQELLAAGVDGGLATAEAIAAGGTAAVEQVNSLTGQLTTMGAELGAQLSGTFYGQGIQAAQSLVDGLTLGPNGLSTLQANAVTLRSQLAATLGAETSAGGRDAGHGTVEGLIDGLDDKEGKLDRAMRRIAKQMIASLKAELDMHSPSRKMFAAGALAGSSVAMGLDSMIDTVRTSASGLASAALVDTQVQLGANGLRGVGVGASSQLLASPIDLRVFLGDREISELVSVEVDGTLQPLRTFARQGVLS